MHVGFAAGLASGLQPLLASGLQPLFAIGAVCDDTKKNLVFCMELWRKHKKPAYLFRYKHKSRATFEIYASRWKPGQWQAGGGLIEHLPAFSFRQFRHWCDEVCKTAGMPSPSDMHPYTYASERLLFCQLFPILDDPKTIR